ncbi:MAG: hypothetical protein R3E48_02165 [Burkholderiaceae bacterium]
MRTRCSSPPTAARPTSSARTRANPLATILSAGLMLDYLGERHDEPLMLEAAQLLDRVVTDRFAEAASPVGSKAFRAGREP